MNKKNTTIWGSIATILVLLLIFVIQTNLLGEFFGTKEQEPKESITVLETATPDEMKGKGTTATEAPKETEKPKETKKPKETEKPEATATPKTTEKPKATATPKPTEKPKATATPKPTEKPKATEKPKETEAPSQVTSDLKFRSKKLLDQHYEKHGIEMGFESAKAYEAAAAAVVANPNALHKTEKEDGDDVYYLEETNEFVIVSKDGYLRTYFLPSGGKKYYDRQ